MMLVIASAASLALVTAHPGSHANCGYPGITKAACEANGQCAMSAGLVSEPGCYYKIAVQVGKTQASCARAGGVWDPVGAKNNDPSWQKHYACYYPNTGVLPSLADTEINGSGDYNEGRQIGHPGTSSYEIVLSLKLKLRIC